MKCGLETHLDPINIASIFIDLKVQIRGVRHLGGCQTDKGISVDSKSLVLSNCVPYPRHVHHPNEEIKRLSL